MAGFFFTNQTAFDELKPSVESKDQIKLALKHYNLLQTDDETRNYIEGELNEFLDKNLGKEPESFANENIKNELQRLKAYYRIPTNGPNEKLFVYKRVGNVKNQILMNHIKSSFSRSNRQEVEYSQDEKHGQGMIELIYNLWENDDSMIWVFSLGDTSVFPGRNFVEEISYKLGLYHWGNLQDGKDKILIFQFSLKSQCYKPTWIDADFTFYFDPNGDERNFGFTKCLKGGEGLKEWIVKKEEVRIEKLRIVSCPGELNLSEPTEEYWEGQREKILKLRRENGSNT